MKLQAEYITNNEATLGRKVNHEKFGIGTIVAVTTSGDDKKLTIAFDKQGVKILLLSLAKLRTVVMNYKEDNLEV